MGTALASSDRAYCRSVLPRVSRTFALNIRLLNGSLGDAVSIAYLLCRTADALEDSWPGEPPAVERRFGLFQSAVSGDEPAAETLAREVASVADQRDDLDLVAHLPRVRRAFATLSARDREAIAEAVLTLSKGMCRYAARSAGRAGRGSPPAPYLDTETELHDYCWVVAGCVGVMLTRLFAHRARGAATGRDSERMKLAPVVGEALQLTNILLDWPVDVRRGRCYVPAEWLEDHRLSPADLLDVSRRGVREIAARLESLARASLARVPDYLETIPSRHVRYRLFCLWPALWALGSLRHARLDPDFPGGPKRPRLPRSELWRSALASLVVGHHGGALRKLYAASG